jgi:signal transduction histidine kinase
MKVADLKEISMEMEGWLNKIDDKLQYMNNVLNSIKGQVIDGNAVEQFTIQEVLNRIDIFMEYELRINKCILNVSNFVENDIRLNGSISSLVQVINNLIINSIQSLNGEKGIIELSASQNNMNVIFSIKDNGSGIDKNIQGKLFKEMITTKGKNGTGLGLYISYSIIKSQFKGDIWFESKQEEGTTFYISIPLE